MIKALYKREGEIPGGVSGRGSSLSADKGGMSSTALSGILNGVGMAPIFASLLGGSSLVIIQIQNKSL